MALIGLQELVLEVVAEDEDQVVVLAHAMGRGKLGLAQPLARTEIETMCMCAGMREARVIRFLLKVVAICCKQWYALCMCRV